MGKLSYFFAVSLDGYIARSDDRVDWLDPYTGEIDSPYGFEPYMASVSTLVSGRKTFEASLKLGPWHFGDRQTYVYTTDASFETDVERVAVVSDDAMGHIRELRATVEGRIWLLGGGLLAANAVDAGLLDEIILTVMPVTIGDGIPWLGNTALDRTWKSVAQYTGKDGVVQLAYERIDD